MAEVLRGKLAASADACLPGVGVSLLVAVGLHASGAGLFALCLLLLLGATAAWSMAWSVRCGLWAVCWPTWAVLAAYGALPLVLASVSMWVLAATQRFSTSAGMGGAPALAWLSVTYIAGAGLAWLVHWNTVNRFEW